MSYNPNNYRHPYNHANHRYHASNNTDLANAINSLNQTCQALLNENAQTKQELARVREELWQVKNNQFQRMGSLNMSVPRRAEMYGNALSVPQRNISPSSNHATVISASNGYHGTMAGFPMQSSPFAGNDIRGKVMAGAVGVGIGVLAALAIGALVINRD